MSYICELPFSHMGRSATAENLIPLWSHRTCISSYVLYVLYSVLRYRPNFSPSTGLSKGRTSHSLLMLRTFQTRETGPGARNPGLTGGGYDPQVEVMMTLVALIDRAKFASPLYNIVSSSSLYPFQFYY